MKKVKNKIIALMLVIPLLLMFGMSTAADAVEILVDVPVSNVDLTINGEKDIIFDILSDEKLMLDVKLEPTTATNTKVNYETQKVEGDKEAKVEITDDGRVIPKSAGTVIVTAIAGAKQDSVKLTFTSDKATEVDQTVSSYEINIGGKRNIGTDLVVYPSTADYAPSYNSSDTKVATVTAQGLIEARLAGSCTITATVDGVIYDNDKGMFVEHTYSVDYNVTVIPNDTDDYIQFVNGDKEFNQSSFNELSTSIDLTLPSDKISKEEIKFDYDKDVIKDIQINEVNGNLSIDAVWQDNVPYGDYEIVLKNAFGEEIGKLTLSRGKIEWNINYDEECSLAVGNSKNIDISVKGLSDYRTRYTSSNIKVATVKKDSESLFKVTAVAEGTTTIKVDLIVDDEIYETKELKVKVVDPYFSISIKNNEATKSITNSLAQELVIGEFVYADSECKKLSKYTFEVPISVSSKSGVIESNKVNYSKLEWSTSNDRIATINKDNGVLSITEGGESGEVTISVWSAYESLLGTDTKKSITLTVIKGAVNISDYDELMAATEANYEIVLQSDIMLAPLLEENYYSENWRKGEYKDYIEGTGKKYKGKAVYKTMDPTCDTAYYKALGNSEDAKLKYFVEFTNNVYGNGHYIDADYLTKGGEKNYGSSTSNGFIFNGPLFLLKIGYSTPATADDNAGIKSQDNIVFVVKNDGVSLRNVELKGCSDSSVNGDLTNLDYCGTVLEVIGDDFDLSYSKVNNGRTVVRIYGDSYTDESKVSANVNDYKISASISNCILTYGREFILKIGTNQLKRGKNVADSSVMLSGNYWYPKGDSRKDIDNTEHKDYYDEANPYFYKADGKTPYTIEETKDGYFIDNYVLTDITLKNCVFVNSGLFSIGMESMFGGLVLDGWDYSSSYRFGTEKGWKDIAGTSYPSRLRFQGDVRFYDWKTVSSVNSDTLLEAGSFIKDKLQFNLNVSNMINQYKKKNPTSDAVSRLLLTSGGEDYINAPVAMYGGGKNYGILDLSGVDKSFSELYELTIPVSYFAPQFPQLVYFAAGIEPFRFMVCEAHSDNPDYLTLDRQLRELADNKTAYTWIYRK